MAVPSTRNSSCHEICAADFGILQWISHRYHKSRMEDSFRQGPQKSLETANRRLPPKPRRNLCAHNVRTCERVQLASLPVGAIQTLRQTATKRKSASRFWHWPVKMRMVFQEAWWSVRHRMPDDPQVDTIHFTLPHHLVRKSQAPC
jgi:hypothetical protein